MEQELGEDLEAMSHQLDELKKVNIRLQEQSTFKSHDRKNLEA